jgi:anion-transporting  ArsA/GET3 family ATPase
VSALGHLVDNAHIVVCAGSGGVGKTTTAAALAVEGARRGRDTVVVTIDPARRLANALGLETLSDTAHEIDRPLWDPEGAAPASGRLSALMLDTKSTFDRLVAKYAGGEEQARGILTNRFYRNVSTALSGTQEYMAMEKLHELHDDGRFELIVVDTPPSRNALDFLDAPDRMTRFLDHRLVRILLFPTRATMRVAGVAAQGALRSLSRVIGSEVIEDAMTFFQAFEGMEEGFRTRAQKVLELLGERSTAFVLVTSPRRDAVEEAYFFAGRLAEGGIPVRGMVVNRIHPRFGEEAPEGLYARAGSLEERARSDAGPGGAAAARLAGLYRNLGDFQLVGVLERQYLAELTDTLTGTLTGTSGPKRVAADGPGRGEGVAVAYVPFLADDVHDVSGLTAINEHLFSGAGAPSVAPRAGR